MDEAIVPEFLQGEVTVKNLRTLIESSPSEQLIDIGATSFLHGQSKFDKRCSPAYFSLIQ